MASQVIQAVVFDLDDTLYGEADYVLSGYRAVAWRLREITGRSDHFEDYLWKGFLAGKSERAFNALSEEFSLNLSDKQIEELVAVYRNHWPDIRPYPGIPDLLGRLSVRYRLGLLSDGFLPAQAYKLQALGLEKYFQQVLFTETLGRAHWKPSTAGFEKISQLLEAPHSACAYVADNPAKDFLPANQLGWLTVQFIQLGQVHSQKPAPPGGQAKRIARSTSELIKAFLK